MQQNDLNTLAFGNHQASTHRSQIAAQENAIRLLPGLREIQFAQHDNFLFKAVGVAINGLAIGAFATSSNRMSFGDRRVPALVFPWAGASNFWAGRPLAMRANSAAIFVAPGQATCSEGGPRSVVVTHLESLRIQATLSAMLGQEYESIRQARVDESRELSLACGHVSFDLAFRSLISQINAYSQDPVMLNLSGIDDAFYRTLAIALHPMLFARQSEMRLQSAGKRQLDRLCQYVVANLGKPITLTALEHVGNMSRRSLHNAFVKAFGLSPMGWVREQRLAAARALLQRQSGPRNVANVLYSCGFTNPSLFSAQYCRRFGETPSMTVSRSQRS